MNTSSPLPNVICEFNVSNSNLLAVKVFVKNANPAIEPDLNIALPLSSILAFAFDTVVALPSLCDAGPILS